MGGAVWFVLSLTGPDVPSVRLETLLFVVERPVETDAIPVERPVDSETRPVDSEATPLIAVLIPVDADVESEVTLL